VAALGPPSGLRRLSRRTLTMRTGATLIFVIALLVLVIGIAIYTGA
jgi:hypothetical protein